jgi:hypothetical protein
VMISNPTAVLTSNSGASKPRSTDLLSVRR